MLMNKNQLNKLRDTFFSWNFISENKKKNLTERKYVAENTQHIYCQIHSSQMAQ